MLSIAQTLQSHGLTHPQVPHTRIPAIWSKLSNLYDLDALDERENTHEFGIRQMPDAADEDVDEEELQEFALPEDDFGNAMWERRFAEGEDSEEDIEGLKRTRGLVEVDIDEERPVGTKGRDRGRPPGKATKRKAQSGRASKESAVSSPAVEEDEEEEEEDDAEDEEESAAEASPPVKTKGPGRGWRKGKGVTKPPPSNSRKR